MQELQRLFLCSLPPPLRGPRPHRPSLPAPRPPQTGRAYGERPPLTLSPHIYPELEAYMDKWRAALEPKHSLLFTQ